MSAKETKKDENVNNPEEATRKTEELQTEERDCSTRESSLLLIGTMKVVLCMCLLRATSQLFPYSVRYVDFFTNCRHVSLMMHEIGSSSLRSLKIAQSV